MQENICNLSHDFSIMKKQLGLMIMMNFMQKWCACYCTVKPDVSCAKLYEFHTTATTPENSG